MKFFKTLSKRGLALFLVLTMCMSLLPATAMAAELEEANHTHNEDGWTCVETRELTCEYDEHTHDETCWGTSEAILTCALEESESHTHGGDCYSAGGASPACGLEEHTHGIECAVSHWDCTAPSDAVKLFLRAVKDIPEEITAEAGEAVASARNAYDALDAAEQINASVVKAYGVLANAEAVLEAIASEEQAKAEAEAEEAARAAALEMIRPFVDAVAGIPETDMISGENFEEVGEYINDVCYDLYMELYGTEYAELDEFKAAEEKFLAAVDRVQELAETVPEMLAADVELTINRTEDLKSNLKKNSSYRWIITHESETGVVELSSPASGYGKGEISITVTGLKPGTATVAFQTQSWSTSNGYVWSTQKTWTIDVVSPVPATDISISGSDTVAEFGTVKLNAVFTPAGSSAKVTWSSDDMGVATVDENGTVTGIASGTATISATIMVDGVAVTATHAITVTRSASTTTATFYYLKTPTCDPASNSTSDWGPAIGTGTIDVTGAQWVGINCFVSSASNRVITWPTGYDNGLVSKGSDTWNTIFEAFKSTVEDGNVTADDIESITLVPYKISDNDKLYHVDCQVVIKAKGLATATFYLWDAGGSDYVYQDAQTVRMGKQVGIPAQVSSLPAEKTANGRTYRLITWHDNSSLSGAAATFPYTVTGNVNFYAKYVADYIVTYDLDGGNWTANPQTNYEAGKTVTVVSVMPQKAGYTFTGWKTSIDSSVINGGSTFTMPEADVTLTAQWEPDENQKHELTYTVKYFQNDVQVGNTVTVTNEFQVLVTEQAVSGVNTTPATGYKLDKILVDGEEVDAVPATATNNTEIEVYFVSRTDLTYTVNYYLEGTTTPVAPSRSVNGQTFGTTVTASAISIDGYVVEGNATQTITIRVENNVINFYYTRDVIGPDGGPDGIADKYQATVTFNVVNGTWAGGGTTRGIVVTLRNASGEPAEDGTYTLTADDIPSGTANSGYSRGAWGTSPLSAVIRRGGDSFTLTYSLTAPVFPAPDPGTEGGTTTIPEDPTPLAPSPDDGDLTIIDEDVPLANAVGLNNADHFAYIIGYEDDTVRPLNNITRAEAVTIFFRLMEDEYRAANWSVENSFSDVNVGNWYNNAVSTCLKAGALVRFAQDDKFLPNQAITRAEFASIAAGFVSEEITGENVGDFSDTEGHWAAEYIRKAVEAGWINGVGGNRFAPDETITRAEVMTMINRMLDRVPDAEHMLPTMKKWTDNPETAWYYEAVQEATNGHDYERDEMGITETWTELKTNRDWKALEAEWAANGGASSPADPAQPVEGESEAADAEGETENA